jgi:hypothetical protein
MQAAEGLLVAVFGDFGGVEHDGGRARMARARMDHEGGVLGDAGSRSTLEVPHKRPAETRVFRGHPPPDHPGTPKELNEGEARIGRKDRHAGNGAWRLSH